MIPNLVYKYTTTKVSFYYNSKYRSSYRFKNGEESPDNKEHRTS